MRELVFDTGMSEAVDSVAYELPEEVRLTEATRYYWNVAVEADDGDTAVSGTAYFETAADMKRLCGALIACEKEPKVCDFFRSVSVKGNVKRARAYVTALGVYEFLCVLFVRFTDRQIPRGLEAGRGASSVYP